MALDHIKKNISNPEAPDRVRVGRPNHFAQSNERRSRARCACNLAIGLVLWLAKNYKFHYTEPPSTSPS